MLIYCYFKLQEIIPKVNEKPKMHIEIQNLLNQANHKAIPMMTMGLAWKKLREAMDVPAATVDTFGAAIKALSIDEKLALVNIINLNRTEYKEVTGLGSMSSPMFSLLKTPVPTLTAEEHKALRLQLGKYGEVAIYLMYPSLPIACYAFAALATNWPGHVVEKDEQEKPISGLAYEHYCYSKDIEAHNSQKDWGDKKPTATQSSVAYRLSTGIITSPLDITKGTIKSHGFNHMFFRVLLELLDEERRCDYKALKEHKRLFYQGATLFGLTPLTSIYDINNVVTLRGPTISGTGKELLSKAQIADREEAYKKKQLEFGEATEL